MHPTQHGYVQVDPGRHKAGQKRNHFDCGVCISKLATGIFSEIKKAQVSPFEPRTENAEYIEAEDWR